VPLGIWYLVEVYSKATRRDWLFAVVYIGCFIVIGMNKIGHTLLADKDSPYPFAPEEMERFDRPGHLARIRSGGIPVKSGRDA
jgi:hypothetical protein